MDIKRNGSRPSAKGTPEAFTGNVRSDHGKNVEWLEQVTDEQYRS